LNQAGSIATPDPQFGTRRHIALIYDGLGDNAAMTATFIRQGLERRQLCLCVHDESSEDTVLDALAAIGVDAASVMAEGRLQLATPKATFLVGDRFNSRAMITSLENTVDAARASGFEGLFVTGEMSFSLGRQPGTQQLMDYEASCTTFFRTHPAVGLCQYNRRCFDSHALRRVLLTHPWVLVDGRLCRNFHCVPAQDPLGEALELPLDVDQVLADLVIREAAERMVAGTAIGIEGSGAEDVGAEDAAGLAKIYSELVLFKGRVLARAEKRAVAPARSQARADNDAVILQLRGELLALQHRLDFWQDRVRRLVGLDYDADTRRVRFQDRSVRLSRRESQLIAALISQSGRPLAARELLWRAWHGNHLAEAQVRTYIAQLRKKLAGLELPAALVNEPGLGYSLKFDPLLTAARRDSASNSKAGPAATG
jgi:DNA-binding winged helix-turn-helix (wHTH) protein